MATKRLPRARMLMMLCAFRSAGPEESVCGPPGTPGARKSPENAKILVSRKKSQMSSSVGAAETGAYHIGELERGVIKETLAL